MVAMVQLLLSIGSKMTIRKFAVIENNKVINVVVGIEEEVLIANPDKYIEYTDGDVMPSHIDGQGFFPKLIIEEAPEGSGPTIIPQPEGV